MEIDFLIFFPVKEGFHGALRVCLLDSHFVNNLRAKRIINKIKLCFALSIIPVCQLKAVYGIFRKGRGGNKKNRISHPVFLW
jgi:hypothetical protein